MLDAVSIDSCRVVSQTLGHSLWQASAVAICCWLVLRTLPAKKAELRYAVTCGGLLSVVLAALITAAALDEQSDDSNVSRLDSQQDSVTVTDASSGLIANMRPNDRSTEASGVENATASKTEVGGHDAQTDTPASHDIVAHRDDAVEAGSRTAGAGAEQPATSAQAGSATGLSWPAVVAGVWVLGVVVMLFRLVRVIVALRQLKSSITPVDDGLLNQVRELVAELSLHMKLRWSVELVVSDKVSMPGILGTFWPTLLMPPAMLTGVPIEQLRIVIAHELAHARRFDFLVNLGQLFVESLLFFNPAVWWLSRQIRIEREACCDAVAVAATGSAVPVARTLLAIVERLGESLGAGAASNFASAAGVQAFSGDESSENRTPLFDRVRRIVTPDQRPHVRIPWYTFLGVIAAYALISVGLYEGAEATVQVVQQVLSPKERVEKIEKLVASQGNLARKEGVSAVARSQSDEPGAAFPDPVTVSGTVRTFDGQPLPVPLAVYGTVSGPGIGGTEGFGNLKESSDVFRFSGGTRSQRSVRGDTAMLSLYIGLRGNSPAAERYAPSALGPFVVRSGQAIEDLEFVLQPGFAGSVRVVTPGRTPVADAFVSGMFHVDHASSYARLSESRSRTNANGITSIPRSTSKLTWTAEIRAAGFQTQKVDLTLQPGKTVDVELKVARPMEVVIMSSVDGQPVSGAQAFAIKEQGRKDDHPHTWSLPDPREDDPRQYAEKYSGLYRYGPSGNAGRLLLDSLAEEVNYDFLILAPGFGPTVIAEVKAGVQSREVSLDPALSVSGQIVGDLSTLSLNSKTKQRYIRYSNPDRNPMLTAVVEERDGKGFFEINGLGKGDLWLRLHDRTIAKELTESVDDLVIDLNEPGRHDHRSPSQVRAEASRHQERQLKKPTRKVILTLVGADPAVSLTGQIRAGFVPGDRPGSYTSQNYDIVDSRVEFDVEVPTRIIWTGRNFTGYSVVKQSEVEVGVADEPFRADVQLLPAGAIRGEVRLADGSLAREFQVDVMPVERIKSFSGRNQRVTSPQPPGEFLLTDVPLGHEYRVLVSDDRIGSVAAMMGEPFVLDDAHSIADLKFQFDEGREHIIRLVDENGEPAAGAKAGGWFTPGSSFSRSMGFRVQDNAEIVLRHISDSIPGKTRLQVKAAEGFIGQSITLDWNDLPDKVTLKQGVSASGQIVDVDSGRGLAGASFFLFPTPSDAATFREAVSSKTDEAGRFSFDSLESINYQVHLHGAVPPRVPFVENDRGNLVPDYTNISDGTFPEWFVQGGRAEPYVIKARIVPRHRLRLTPPSPVEK